MISMRFLLIGALLCRCGHDATRENPLDPQLTPPQLEVALADTAGTVTLTWTPYAGQVPFSAYWVLRQATGLIVVDTLARFSHVDNLSFTDSLLAIDTAYDYRVSAVNVGGYEASSEHAPARPLQLPPVRIATAEFRSMSATAQLAWTRYRGPRFAGYELRRTTDAGNARIVVLDEDGGYITQFGTKGSGPGQFELGDGAGLNTGLSFCGSVAVDGDGFIYVADVGNRRIQKFAP